MVLLGITLIQQSGQARTVPRAFGFLALFAGSMGLVALMLLLSGHYLGGGAGGMERVVAYPLPLVLAIIGFYLFFVLRGRRQRFVASCYLRCYLPTGLLLCGSALPPLARFCRIVLFRSAK